jgi:hypothetical protein
VTLRQTVVPLGRTITRFGASAPPGGATRFDPLAVTVAGASPGIVPAQDLFAPAQFEDMSDDEKLTRPDFERMDAGFTVGRQAVTLAAGPSATLAYETRIIDSTFETRPADDYHPRHDLLVASVLSAGLLAPLRGAGPAKFAPPPSQAPLAGLAGERFVIVSTVDLTERREIVLPTAKGAVLQALAAHLTSHPEDRGRLDVMSLDELAA